MYWVPSRTKLECQSVVISACPILQNTRGCVNNATTTTSSTTWRAASMLTWNSIRLMAGREMRAVLCLRISRIKHIMGSSRAIKDEITPSLCCRLLRAPRTWIIERITNKFRIMKSIHSSKTFSNPRRTDNTALIDSKSININSNPIISKINNKWRLFFKLFINNSSSILKSAPSIDRIPSKPIVGINSSAIIITCSWVSCPELIELRKSLQSSDWLLCPLTHCCGGKMGSWDENVGRILKSFDKKIVNADEWCCWDFPH